VERHLIGRDGAERLARLPLFEGVPAAQRRMLGELGHEFTAQAGERLIVENEHGYEFTMIEEGEVEVVQHGERIRELGPGDFFGELAILGHGIPRTATVIAKTNMRGVGFSSHFIHQIRERIPLVGERIERAARERLERDARAAGSGGE
jgi:CRP-like cAMP-binding protein